MMQTPRQIIAIPTFNRRAELTACLSCLGQAEGLGDWRVIVGDDCSTEYDIAELVKGVPFPCEIIGNDPMSAAMQIVSPCCGHAFSGVPAVFCFSTAT